MVNIFVLFVGVTLLWPREAETTDEDEKIEKYFARMLKEQEGATILEVQHARLKQRRVTLSAEDQARYWRLNKEYEVCLQERANLPLHDVIRRAIAVPEGKSEITLSCPGYCRNPVSPKNAQWGYAKKGEFVEAAGPVMLDERTHLITSDGDLILGDIKVKDSGLYSCSFEGHVIVVWLLVVIPRSGYVTRFGSDPPDIQRQEYEKLNVTAEIQLSSWSPCSRCHDIGNTFRYGVCFLISNSVWPEPEDRKVTMRNELRMLLAYRETGVPCRSKYMDLLLKDLPDIEKLPDFVQYKRCRVPCSSADFVFFKDKRRPRYSKIPVASAMKGEVDTVTKVSPRKFTEKIWIPGNDLYLKCPGIEDRNEVFWTKGQVPLETIIREGSVFENRISVMDDGRVMVRRPTEDDMGMYACYKWGQKEPTGAVKVKTEKVVKLVKTEVREYMEEVLMLVPLILILVAVLLVACCTGRHHEETDNPYT